MVNLEFIPSAFINGLEGMHCSKTKELFDLFVSPLTEQRFKIFVIARSLIVKGN